MDEISPVEQTITDSVSLVEQIQNAQPDAQPAETLQLLHRVAENITNLVFHLTRGRELYGNQWRRAQHFEQQATELEMLLQFIPGDAVYRAICEIRARQHQLDSTTQEAQDADSHAAGNE